MAVVKGATSLVELILKKFGDDTAGAAKELERLGGFPESVSQRIASGELPMDEASRMARAQEQGYDTSRRWHHGTNSDFKEFDPERVGSAYGTDDQGFYFTSSEDEAWKWAENAPNAGSPRTVETLLAMDNPWLIDAPAGRSPVEYFESGEGVFNRGQNAAVDYGIESGYDGMVVAGEAEDLAVAFDPSRIRSPNAAYDPQYKGSNMMGGALAAGVGLGALSQSEDAEAGFITKGGKTLLEAFHGSPHKFDKFSMDAIGTGEGNQKYGHGLYFADSEDVAKGYRDSLTSLRSEDWSLGDDRVPGWVVDAVDDGGADVVLSDFKRRAADTEKLIAEGTPQPWVQEQQKAEAERMIGVVNRLSSGEKATAPGSLYRTEIDVTPESLLDWDKPLSEQSDHIKSEFAKYADERGMAQETRDQFRGEQIYERLGSSIDPERGRGLLLDKNIKGIKYLDGDSRAAGDGTSNYVIFDDSLINIAERGNADPRLLAGTAAGTAGLLALGASDDADAGVAGRVLAESGLAYKQLRKQVARNKQNGISPGNTVKQWVHDKKNTTYNDMNSYATKVDGGKGGDYYKQQTQNIVDQILEGVENPDKDLVAGLAEWNGARQSRELGHRPDWEKGAASPGLLGGTAAVTAGALATPALMKDEPFDPTAPLPAPDFATQMGKAGEVLGTVLDAPMTGLQGIARGLFGLIDGEDLVTAGAEAGHMMKGGSEEGFDRVGDKVEGLFAPIDKQFPYLNVGKSAGDATSLLMSLFSPI